MWNIIGHEAAIGLLDNSLKNDRLSHAYLFTGPAGVGKMTLAVNLAQALNCESDDRPCGDCNSCKRIMESKHADVQVIDLAGRSEISIDQIRELERYASLKPFEGKCRVFIIDNSELMSSEAANCLLKTLEEPPPFVYFILMSSNEKALLSTILSRCQKLELRPVALSEIELALTERYEASPEHARVLARLSSGCMGWTIRASIDPDILSNRSEQLRTLVDIAKADRLDRFSHSADISGQFSRNRAEVQKLLSLWISWWRDLLLIKSGCRDIITNIDHEEALFHEEACYDIIDISDFILSLILTGTLLKNNANPRLALDVLMMSMPKRKVADPSTI
jgi:DNA polymerase-3 subunit delta'